jgi:ABC-type transport system substrate-binding protein
MPVTAQFPLFTIYLGAVDGNPARIAFAGIITDILRQNNIDAHVAFGPWSTWFDRVLFPNASTLGSTYLEGGWDAFFLGWNWGSSRIDPTPLYDNDSIPTFNFCIINDPQIEILLENITKELNLLTRIQYQKALQAYTHELSALLCLHYDNQTWVHDPNLEGFANQTYVFPQYGDPMFRNPDETAIKVGHQIYPYNISPLISYSYQNQPSVSPLYECLFEFSNSQAMFSHDLSPRLATGPWIVQNNGLNLTLQLRNDVYWPDGYQFNASDVIMTYRAIVTPVVGSRLYEDFVAAGLTNESFHILSPHIVRVTLNETLGPYAWAAELLGTVPIMSYAQMGGLNWAEWSTHGTNTGEMWTGSDVNGDPFPVYGPYGLGPYVCRTVTSGFDTNFETFSADRRMGPNDAGLVNGTIIPYYGGSNGFYGSPFNDQWKVIEPHSSMNSISDLQNGIIDIIHPWASIEPLLSSIDSDWGTIISEVKLGFQSLGLNMMHPVFGTGIATPNGLASPENASLYAKYVRQAINYLIPRQAMIDQILEGFAVAGYEYMPPILPAFNSEIEPYRYDPAKARELLRMAGYHVPEPTTPIPTIPPEVFIILFGVIVIIVQVVILGFLQLRHRRKKGRIDARRRLKTPVILSVFDDAARWFHPTR